MPDCPGLHPEWPQWEPLDKPLNLSESHLSGENSSGHMPPPAGHTCVHSPRLRAYWRLDPSPARLGAHPQVHRPGAGLVPAARAPCTAHSIQSGRQTAPTLVTPPHPQGTLGRKSWQLSKSPGPWSPAPPPPLCLEQSTLGWLLAGTFQAPEPPLQPPQVLAPAWAADSIALEEFSQLLSDLWAGEGLHLWGKGVHPW